MLNISPVRTSAQLETQSIERPQSQPILPAYESTLCSAGSKNKGISGFFSNCFSWISKTCSRIWTAIKNAFSKCFGYAKEEGKDIDWDETKKIFTGIYEAVFPGSSAAGNDEKKSCQKRFNLHYKQLSDQARVLFQKHIGFAIARKQGAQSKEEEEQYTNEKWSGISIEFKDILSDISRMELKAAVKSFGIELERH